MGQVNKLEGPPPADISQEDQTTIERHADIKKAYSPGGAMRKWGEKSLPRDFTEAVVDLLVESEILTKPQVGRQIIILSPSANTALLENALLAKTGPGYRIISGDLANLKLVEDSKTEHLQLDASFLPFPSKSVDVILDFHGATWHEAGLGETKPEIQGEQVKTLFRQFHDKLTRGGLVIVDESSYVTPATGAKIDKVVPGGILEGFKEPIIVKGKFSIRAYRKK